ncbi:MAG: HNH endonuclease [Nitrospirae bacterium]|nr:HNH endonuclease [Nitrospirota bacterium]MCL5977544.1 HNH endonuclease [Nitrospirota bacterium]
MMRFVPEVTEEDIKRERSIARELRKSAWWKKKCSQGRCYYCHAKVHPKELTMDHIVPLIRGGRSTKINTVTACKECNNKKKHMLPMEWEEYLNSLS